MALDIVARVHTLWGVYVYTDDMDAEAIIGGITNQSIASATECRQSPANGEAFPQFLAMYAQKPVAEFTSLNLAQAIDAVGLIVLPIRSDSNRGVNFFAQKYEEGSVPAAGASHRAYTLRDGLLIPRKLSASHQQDASIDYSALITWDGTNDPIVPTDNVSLPAGLEDFSRYALGPITIGGEALDQVTNLEIDFGVDARTTGAQSAIWDTHSSIRRIMPRLMITGIDAEWFKSTRIPLRGKAGTHANTSIYLRKRDDSGTFVDAGNAEHIRITADGLVYAEQLFSAGEAEDGTVSLAMPLRYDGTNAPLVIDTASTHP
jgi:hypothetical protein